MIQSKRFGIAAIVLAFVVMTATAAWSRGDDSEPGWLGVTIQEVTKDLRDALPRGTEDGVLVNAVADDSPAAKAGLKDGDVITRFDRQTVRSTDDLTRAVRDAGAGATVPIEYYRNGRLMRDRVTLGETPEQLGWNKKNDEGNFVWVDKDGTKHELKDGKYKVVVREGDEDEPEVTIWHEGDDDTEAPDQERHRIVIKKRDKGDDEEYMVWPGKPGEKPHGMMMAPDIRKKLALKGLGDLQWVAGDRPKLGVMLMDLGGQLADYFGAKDGGVLISEVVDESPAAKAGLKAGDVITEVDGNAVEDAADVRKQVRDAVAGDQVKVSVLRNHRPETFSVTIEKSDAEWSDMGPMEGPPGIFKHFQGGDQDFDFRAPAPDMRQFEFRSQDRDALKSDLDALRKEMQELRKELSDLKARKP